MITALLCLALAGVEVRAEPPVATIGKPEPHLLLAAAAAVGADAAGAVMIGDALTDVAAGQAVGARTVLMLTGTSALVRSVAERMISKGLLYPGEAVRDWLREPDFTHISNEVSFTPDCPPPTHQRYCINGVAMNFTPE